MELVESIFTPIVTELTERPVFWILSVIMLVSALMVVSLKNIFHCAIYLIFCLFSVAGMFILLDAEFLAAAQVLIYVGAVAILMIFAIMLSSQLANRRIRQTSHNAFVVAVVSTVFAVGSIGLIAVTDSKLYKLWEGSRGDLPVENALTIGKYLMTQFMLPFEVVSVLLLAAMIGAIVLARKERS